VIDFERFSITEKISELMDRLKVHERLTFHEIFEPDTSRAELIITFLAILEMTRLRLTRLIQAEPLAPIYIELLVREDEVSEDDLSEEDAEAQPTDDTESMLGDDQEYE
jgi:segregation and condensation protein A